MLCGLASPSNSFNNLKQPNIFSKDPVRLFPLGQ